MVMKQDVEKGEARLDQGQFDGILFLLPEGSLPLYNNPPISAPIRCAAAVTVPHPTGSLGCGCTARTNGRAEGFRDQPVLGFVMTFLPHHCVARPNRLSFEHNAWISDRIGRTGCQGSPQPLTSAGRRRSAVQHHVGCRLWSRRCLSLVTSTTTTAVLRRRRPL